MQKKTIEGKINLLKRRTAMPKVSVVVPVYNVQNTLERCVRSLQEQTLKDLDIILVDDGATDNSGKLADELARHDDRIRVIHKKNEGLGLTRNAGIEAAAGDYIGFVDSDDYVKPEMYEKLWKEAQQTGSDIVYGGYVRVYDGKVSSTIDFGQEQTFTGQKELTDLMLSLLASPANAPEDSKYGSTVWKGIYRRELLMDRNIRFYSEREIVSEDSVFQIDALSAAKKAAVIPGTYYYYEYNPASLTAVYRKGRFEQNKKLYELATEKIEKHFDSPEAARQFTRNFLAAVRVCLMQEVFHEQEHGKNQTIASMKAMNTDPLLQKVLSEYPWKKLPFKKRIFTWAMAHDAVWLERLLVKASS